MGYVLPPCVADTVFLKCDPYTQALHSPEGATEGQGEKKVAHVKAPRRLCLPFLLVFLFVQCLRADEEESFARERKRMVEEQIEARGIKDPRVLRTMLAVPRHLFVPPELRRFSYEDRPLPIGSGQTISQPYIVALMTELLGLEEGHVVLEVGTGSGYQAAVLSKMTKKVFTIEINKRLGKRAQERLMSLGCENVEVVIGDGYNGLPEAAPFDAIIVTAAVPHIPQTLIRQLRPGGKMVIPLGRPFEIQSLTLVTKEGEDRIRKDEAAPVLFVPLVRESSD